MSSVMSKLFGGTPKQPHVAGPATPVDPKAGQGANDELMARLAKLRRANMVSDLSAPNIRRRQLGAGV